MKRLLCLVWASATLACATDPAVHSVYVLPMAHGLDQYVANRLANAKVFRVVVDPKLADAVLTDRLGEGFEQQLATLIPPPPQPEKKDAKAEEQRVPVMFGDSVNKLSNPALNSSFGRGKGTIFLVDVKTHSVIWSMFEPSRGTAGQEMDKTASEIIEHLKKDLGFSK